MRDIVILMFVIVAYILGHMGGYRLCKLRVKNMLKTQMFSYHHTYPNKPAEPLDTVSNLLLEVGRL